MVSTSSTDKSRTLATACRLLSLTSRPCSISRIVFELGMPACLAGAYPIYCECRNRLRERAQARIVSMLSKCSMFGLDNVNCYVLRSYTAVTSGIEVMYSVLSTPRLTSCSFRLT